LSENNKVEHPQTQTQMTSDVRRERQRQVYDWTLRCFGNIAIDLEERATRQLEEAIELAQCEGLPRQLCHSLIDYVYSKEPGKANQEVGGIAITLLAYCEAKGLDADECEVAELNRILSKTSEHFRERQNAKASNGVARESA